MSATGLSRGWIGALALITLMALATGAAAQPAAGPGLRGAPPRSHERVSPEEVGGMVDAYLVSNLQEALGLSEEKYVEVLPLVTRLRKDRRDAFMMRRRLLRDLRKQLKSGSATEAQTSELLNQLKKGEAESMTRQARNMESLDSALTPLQQAKYRVLEAEVEQRMHQLLAEARRHRIGAGAKRRAQDGEMP